MTTTPRHPAARRHAAHPLSTLAAMLSLTLPQWAAAQASTPTPPQAPASAPEADAAMLPTVRVSARRANDAQSYTAGATQSATGLTLSLRDTPQSLTVITQERIRDQAMDSVSDALRSTPGVSFKATDRGRNSLSVRGFDIDSFQYDGVPVATGNVGGETGSTVIYDRVEVVRGATGLLSGAGNPSAAVNLVRKRASSKVFTGSVEATLGSWQHRGVTLDLGAPLTADGSIRARLVANAEQQDAFIDLENTKRTVLYGVIDADLSPRTRLSIGFSDQADKRNGVYWGGLTYWYADGSRTSWDRSKTTATHWNQWDTRQRTVFGTLSHLFENLWRVSLDLTHYKQHEESMMLWLTGVPDRSTGLGLQAEPYHYRAEPTQNQVSLTASGPFRLWGRAHELSAGLTYSRARGGWDNADLVGMAAPVGNFNGWDGAYARPEMTPLYVGSRDTTVQSGAYAAARLQLSDPLKLIVGARLSQWKQDNEAGAWTTEPFTIEHRNEITPYAGLVFDLSAETSLYASYTNIFKPQTARDRNGRYLDPLIGKSYEAGLKGEFLAERLNASAAVFRIDQDNFAVEDTGFLVPGTNTPAQRASKGVRSQGYELEVSGELAPGWSIGGGWTQFSVRDAQGADVALDHPRKLLKLFGKYAFQGRLQGLSVGFGVDWESAQLSTAKHPVTGLLERVGQPAHAVADLMARYDIGKQAFVQLNIDNLFDEKYYSSSWSGYTYGQPRGATLTAGYRF
jgi:outer membrane receptor for ferric coprogen and ferric-rhodotorulic acid